MKRNSIFQTILFITFTVLSYSFSSAQTSDTIQSIIENGWIEKMNTKIGVDVSVNNAFEIFEVQTTDTKYVLYPNTPTNLRLNVNYRFISFGFQFSPDFIPGNGDEDLKGTTKSFGLGTSLIFKHWIFDLSYAKVKGYYLDNSSDFDSSWTKGDPYFQFPDLHYKGFAFASGYSTNSKFSFRSLSSQTERQLKSAGSFIPIFNFRYFIIDNKDSEAINTQKSNNYEASVGPGYAYTFVFREKFYLSLGLHTSIGYLNTKLTTRLADGNVITNQDNFIFRWDTKTGIGYNGDRFYTGLYANVSGTKYNQENTTAVNFETRVNYHLFFGIRLRSPSYIERQVKKIEDKYM